MSQHNAWTAAWPPPVRCAHADRRTTASEVGGPRLPSLRPACVRSVKVCWLHSSHQKRNSDRDAMFCSSGCTAVRSAIPHCVQRRRPSNESNSSSTLIHRKPEGPLCGLSLSSVSGMRVSPSCGTLSTLGHVEALWLEQGGGRSKRSRCGWTALPGTLGRWICRSLSQRPLCALSAVLGALLRRPFISLRRNSTETMSFGRGARW
eukprot:3920406-Prymnesium_polylepis.2